MNQLKKLMLFTLMILMIQLKSQNYNAKNLEILEKIPHHEKYITTQEFNNLMPENN